MSTLIEFSAEADIDIIVEPFTGTARGKEVILDLAESATACWFRITRNDGTGASGDPITVRFMGSTTYHQYSGAVEEHKLILQTASTQIRFVLGYSGSTGAYDNNHPTVEIIEVCE